jgi:hypothetical protein
LRRGVDRAAWCALTGFHAAPAPIVTARLATSACAAYVARVRVHAGRGPSWPALSPTGEAGGSPCRLCRGFPCQGPVADPGCRLRLLPAPVGFLRALRARPLTPPRRRQARFPFES